MISMRKVFRSPLGNPKVRDILLLTCLELPKDFFFRTKLDTVLIYNRGY